MVTAMEDQTFISLMEMDMVNGDKRTIEDLARYNALIWDQVNVRSKHWRHKESGEIYTVIGTGFAATGSGKLVFMIHYVPVEYDAIPLMKFERQYKPFLEKFEPVARHTVWDRA